MGLNKKELEKLKEIEKNTKKNNSKNGPIEMMKNVAKVGITTGSIALEAVNPIGHNNTPHKIYDMTDQKQETVLVERYAKMKYLENSEKKKMNEAVDRALKSQNRKCSK